MRIRVTIFNVTSVVARIAIVVNCIVVQYMLVVAPAEQRQRRLAGVTGSHIKILVLVVGGSGGKVTWWLVLLAFLLFGEMAVTP